jgi:S1-C subfamily serine protease
MLRAACCVLAAVGCPSLLVGQASAGQADTIAKVKPSIVAVGTFQRTRNPQFNFSGTGFAVGDGSLVATNAHVVPKVLDSARQETLVVALAAPSGGTIAEVRAGRVVGLDAERDLAIVRIEGRPLPALAVRPSATVRDGQEYFFTGYPIGTVLGLIPATHRAMISAVTPIAIPTNSSQELDARTVRQLKSNPYAVFQLDATAYPGNSGSPLYDPETGEVIGVINMVFVKGSRETAISQPSGISFAIPSAPLLELMKSAQAAER